MTRADYSTEQFAGFLADLKESFWGDLRGQARQTLKTLLEVDAKQQMEEYLGLRRYQRPPEGAVRADSRKGFYERDYVTPLGIIRLRVPRTRRRSFLPRGLPRLVRSPCARAPGGDFFSRHLGISPCRRHQLGLPVSGKSFLTNFATLAAKCRIVSIPS
ncbi:MAG: transposase [Acidobacteriia bacterium]|nr:transposase [Terriglobia bacterium]